MHPLTIIKAELTENNNVAVTTQNGETKIVTAEFLNGCTGCDVHTLEGAVGQIWD